MRSVAGHPRTDRTVGGDAARHPRRASDSASVTFSYHAGVIDRYALPELRDVFGERRRLELWLRIELLAVEALHAAGVVPDADWERIRAASTDVDLERAHQIERESQHDVIAFLRSVTERMGPEGRWLHFGLTSSDVLDTATAVQLRDATRVVEGELQRLLEVVRRLAIQHRHTPMVGRSHGIHAEPITFGFKAAGWYAELQRDAAAPWRSRARSSRSGRYRARSGRTPTSAPTSSASSATRWGSASTRHRPRS